MENDIAKEIFTDIKELLKGQGEIKTDVAVIKINQEHLTKDFNGHIKEHAEYNKEKKEKKKNKTGWIIACISIFISACGIYIATALNLGWFK